MPEKQEVITNGYNRQCTEVMNRLCEDPDLHQEVNHFVQKMAKGSGARPTLESSVVRRIIAQAVAAVNDRSRQQHPERTHIHIEFYQACQTLKSKPEKKVFDKQEIETLKDFVRQYKRSFQEALLDILLGNIPDPDQSTLSILLDLVQNRPQGIQSEVILNFAIRHLHLHHPQYSEEELLRITRGWVIHKNFPHLWRAYEKMWQPHVGKKREQIWNELDLEQVINKITLAVKLRVQSVLK